MQNDSAKESGALYGQLEPGNSDAGGPAKFVLPFDHLSGESYTDDSFAVTGQNQQHRKSTNLDFDFSSSTDNYNGPWIDPKNQRRVSSSASADLLENHGSQSSALNHNYFSNSIPNTISEENLSKNSKKSNSAKCFSSKASRSSGSQHQQSRSEHLNGDQSSVLSSTRQPTSIDGSASENSNQRSSTDSKSKIKPNSRSISSVDSAALSTSGSAASIGSQNLSQHGSKSFNKKKMEAVRQISGTGENRFSSSDATSGGADSIDSLVNDVASQFVNGLNSKLDVRSALPSTGISVKNLDNFEPKDQNLDHDSDVSNAANDIGFNITANTDNTIDHLASVMQKKPDRLSDITSKKQSSSRKHGSSSSSSKKSLSDSNEDYDNSENINNNKRLTWKQLSELRSFKNLQGVHSLQQCFANAFGYTDGLDGTTMTPVPDGISKRFKRHLTAHYDDLANNGNISKMFERLRKQEGDTYQAVSDKWDATRALVRGLVPPPDT